MPCEKVAVFGKANDVKKDILVKQLCENSSKFTYINLSPLRRFQTFNRTPSWIAAKYQIFLLDPTFKPFWSEPLTLDRLEQFDGHFNPAKATLVVLCGESMERYKWFKSILTELAELKSVRILFLETKLEAIGNDVLEEALMELLPSSEISNKTQRALMA